MKGGDDRQSTAMHIELHRSGAGESAGALRSGGARHHGVVQERLLHGRQGLQEAHGIQRRTEREQTGAVVVRQRRRGGRQALEGRARVVRGGVT
jgi:hypothetical protein